MHAHGLSFFAIFIILLMLITIPGVIMGWVAAGRIRRSEGKLYGMRFAAFAALFVPIIIIFILMMGRSWDGWGILSGKTHLCKN